MAQKNIINKVKTDSGYDSLYPLTPYQINYAKSVTGDGSYYDVEIDLPAENITQPIMISFSPNVPNFQDCTISVNEIGAKTIFINGTPANDNELLMNETYLVQYDPNEDLAKIISSSAGIMQSGNLKNIDRYNIPQVVHNTGAKTLKGKNLFEGDWTKGSGGLASRAYNGIMVAIPTDSSYDVPHHLINAFNSTGWRGSVASRDKSMTINMGREIELTKLSMSIDVTASHFTSFNIEGSMNNVDFETLYSLETYQSGVNVCVLSNTNSYQYYRFTIKTNSASNFAGISNLQVVEYKIPADEFVLTNPISEYFMNQRVLIEVPSDLSTDGAVININSLGDKAIYGDLVIGKKYELTYDGTKFNAREMSNVISPNLSIKTGSISNRGVIPKTNGFTNYLYMVSPREMTNNSLSVETAGIGGTAYIKIECKVEQDTRVVTVGTYSSSSSTITAGTANYTEIAWN